MTVPGVATSQDSSIRWPSLTSWCVLAGVAAVFCAPVFLMYPPLTYYAVALAAWAYFLQTRLSTAPGTPTG